MEQGRHISWRYLPFALLVASFTLSSNVSPDACLKPVGDANNPSLFFITYLATASVVFIGSIAHKRVRTFFVQFSTLACLFPMFIGLAGAFVFEVVKLNTIWQVCLSGACVGLTTAILFLKWGEIFSGIEHRSQMVKMTTLSFLAANIIGLFLDMADDITPNLNLMLTGVFIFLSSLPLEKPRRQNPDGCPSDKGLQPGRLAGHNLWLLACVIGLNALTVGFSWGASLIGKPVLFATPLSAFAMLGKVLANIATLISCRSKDGLLTNERQTVVALCALAIGCIAWTALPNATFAALILMGVSTGLAETSIWSEACIAGGRIAPPSSLPPVAICCASVTLPIILGIVLAPITGPSAALFAIPVFAINLLAFLGLKVQGVIDSPSTMRRRFAPLDKAAFQELADTVELSPREKDIFLLLACGYSSNYIASQLDLSMHTVKTHVRHIYSKMEVHTKDEFLEAVNGMRPVGTQDIREHNRPI